MGTSDTSPTPERDELATLKALLAERDTTVTSQRATIAILEEQLRLATHKTFAPSSEKLNSLGHPDLFFNEAEMLGTKPETDAQAAEIVVPAHTRERGKWTSPERVESFSDRLNESEEPRWSRARLGSVGFTTTRSAARR